MGAGLDGKDRGAAGGNGVDGVEREIEDDLFDLGGVGLNPDGCGGQRGPQLAARLADLEAEHRERLVHHDAQVDETDRGMSRFGELQELENNRGGLGDALADELRVGACLWIGGELD